jgi:hypothetical protein
MPETTSSLLARRHVFAAAAGVGALAAAAAVLPRFTPTTRDVAGSKTPPEQGGGYQLTQHVLRYYQTARL